MPLSHAFNPNKPPNIKDVQYTPEKKSEKIFDPERDITEEDWKAMLEYMNMFRGTWEVFLARASELLTLFPDRRDKLQLSEPEFQGMLSDLNQSRQPGWWEVFATRASQILTLFPERRDELKLGETEFQGILETLNHFRQLEWWGELAPLVSRLSTLFPERRDELKLGEAELKGILENLNGYRHSGAWYGFSYRASRFLTFFPERRGELNLGVSDFEGTLERLNKLRESGKWGDLTTSAADLKILLADEIKRKEDGTLEIIFNKPKQTELKEETPPLPITRNY